MINRKLRNENPILENTFLDSNKPIIKEKKKIVDEDEEIFPENKFIGNKNFQSKSLKDKIDDEDDFLKYKNISLTDLLKKK